MKIRRAITHLLLGAAVLGVLTGGSPPQPDPPAKDTAEHILPTSARGGPQAVTIVRRLILLQQRIVLGDLTAKSEQIATAGDVGRELAGLPDEVWSNYRNREALETFVLIGGKPDLLGAIIEKGLVPEAELPLARGVHAYALRDTRLAYSLLAQTEPRDMMQSLAGSVALAKAVLAMTEAPDKAKSSLDEALLLSPGTFVEETALRLSLDLAIKNDDASLAYRRASRYFIRFRSSPFFETVIAPTVRFLGSSSLAAAPDALRKFKMLILTLPPDSRPAASVELAEAALLAGNFAVAIAAAHDAGTADDFGFRTAGRIIEGAARVVGDDREAAIKLIDEAEKEGPPGRFAVLAAAAREVKAFIEQPIELPSGPSGTGDQQQPPEPEPGDEQLIGLIKDELDKAKDLVERARALLAETKPLLDKGDE